MNKISLYTIVIIVLLPLFSEGGLCQPFRPEETHAGTVTQKVRPPAASGTFYPGSSRPLQEMVTSLLDSTPEISPEGEILAAIAPHAGYVYSGNIAACTHKALSEVDFDTLVIIGHDTYRNAVALTCPVNYFQTPLGMVEVDREMIDRMHAFNQGIRDNYSLHSREHSIEIQLPFLQVLGRECKIVPILFGDPTPGNCRILSDAILAAANGKRVFVLASTDMSHYPPYELARKVDHSTLAVLKTLDVKRLFSHLTENKELLSTPGLQTAMCSRGGVGTAIFFARHEGADRVQVLGYANSGDAVSGDKNHVVGYSSVLIVNSGTGSSR